MPAAHEGLPRRRLGERAVVAHRLDGARQLGGGGDVAAEHAAGPQRRRHGVEAFPRREHVEHDAVDVAFGQLGLQVADGDRPGWVRRAEVALDVAPGDVGEVLAPLVRRQPAARPDGLEQRHRQGAGADPGLDDVRAGEDVGHLHNVAGVLGVDDLRAAGHRQHVVAQQRLECEVLRRADRHDDGVGAADEAVMVEDPLVGVELSAHLEGDRVHPALGVGELYLVARGEGSAPSCCSCGHPRRA